ncbi:MAG TPA: SUMF1/EgtB/PvdO family nonheme iron enzyme [Nitrospira sp.]|nr:SUMF1/EgtB/PvdO family nonheme iron enzyme [Nitrospira sp.]
MRRAKTAVVFMMILGCMTITMPIQAVDSLIPADMVYVGYVPSVMGLDEGEPVTAGNASAAYSQRNRTPASTFHDESPAHMVFLDPYLIDKYEVSNKNYKDFLKSTGYPAPAYWDDPRLNRPELPVVGVSWNDARTYCEYLSKRLPTEAEWEKAARGPHGNLYPWGNEFDPARANFGKTHEATMPVDSYPDGVSYYGLHHMAGNVFEWVSDWYDPRFYSRLEPMVNPTGPSKPVWLGGTGTHVDFLTLGEKRVIRGGSWIAPEATLRATHRFWNHPSNNSYGVGLGFRCAKTAPPEIELQIRQAHTTALMEMGREHFVEAQEAVARGLSIDPKHAELLELRSMIERTKKP